MAAMSDDARPKPQRQFTRSREHTRRAQEVIPAGAHTYAKADDQFAEDTPVILTHGKGCRVWDLDGNEYIELGMGLRTVGLGHAFEPVVAAVRDALALGTNFSRPAAIELEAAEMLQSLIPAAEMVKFCKNGSDALDGAVKLARAFTGRDMIAICGNHPFFSVGDWFIGTTGMPGGIPSWIRQQTVKFDFNDLASVERLFEKYPKQISCVIMEACRVEEPAPGFLPGLHEICRKHGALFILDEMITGFRWHRSGAQHVYGIRPDLTTFGKAMGNGFAVSALCGRRDVMEVGGFTKERERVFLLSTTHGAEIHSLAAAMAVMRFYKENEVTDVLLRRGQRLKARIDAATAAMGLSKHFEIVGRPCSMVYAARDEKGAPSNAFRTLFLQETVLRGLIAPSFVVSYSHTDADIDRAADICIEALGVYREALNHGVHRYLRGRVVAPVMRPYA
jgi:glutamate-1-semialdehyde 2,1-aminomutase